MSSSSFVWKHFTKVDQDHAKCHLCDRVIKCSGGSTSGLRRHLELKHEELEEETPSAKRTKTLDGYFSRASKCLGEILAEMAALNGFSFHGMANCEYLRSALRKDGFTLPKNPTEISKQVRVFADGEKMKLAGMFRDMTMKGQRFSLTIDEYTSSQHKRYMSINVHSGQTYWNLGVVHVHGSMPAENVKALVEDHLQHFNLKMDQDVVCCTTDGASVMVKFGRLVLPELQLCYAHAVHLAVTDVLYRHATTDRESEESEEDEDSADSDDEYESEDGYRSVRVRADMNRSVERVRKIARHFHKSPVSSDKLRECVKQDLGKELSLILDCRTRWNSLADMLDRYIALHRPVTKTLVDINNALIISNLELALIKELNSCLKPVKMGAEALCNRDTTLVKADGIFIFMIDQLTKQHTPLSLEMRDAIERRFVERRQKNLVSLYR